MSKQKINGFIVYRTANYWEDHERFKFSMYDPREHKDNDEVFVKEHAFEVELPDNFDPRPQQIAALEARKQKVRAEFAARITELDTQISKLQALEFAGNGK